MHFILIFIYVILYQINKVASQFNMSIYQQMPPLFSLDNYDACLKYKNGENATYCTVFGKILPNETSELWQHIETFSRDSRHLRHDEFIFGICLKRCLNLLDTLNQTEISASLYNQNITENEVFKYFTQISGFEYHLEYGNLLETCINYNFKHKYNLTLQTVTVSCDKNNVTNEFDTLEIVMFTILVCIGIAIIYSTLYDFVLKHKQTTINQHNNDFYKIQLQSNKFKHIFYTSFSLCRNYYRITMPSKNPATDDFKFINCLRVCGLFLAITAHILLIFMSIPTTNPNFLEQFFYRFETVMLRNSNVVTQIFFIISSFLLYYNLTEKKVITPQKSNGKCTNIFFKLCINRYLRLTPTLMLAVLINATILPRLLDGPIWQLSTMAETTFCRHNWWKHALYVNNFMVIESCLHQTWQLAADFQLYIMFLMIIIIFEKYPKLKTPILTLLVVLSFILPALITYFLEIDATTQFKPENYRYLYFKDMKVFIHIVLPFYTNFGGYLTGIFCVDLYRKLQQQSVAKQFQQNLTYQLLWWLIFPGFCSLLIAASIFTSHEWEKPSIWIAIFAAFYHNLWDVICFVAILGMCLKLGWIAYEFCNLPIFETLSKISYQTFLGHTVVLRAIMGYMRQPLYINYLQIIGTIVLGYVLSNIFGFFLALFVEYPLSELMKLLFKTFEGNNDKNVAKSFQLKDTNIERTSQDTHKSNLRQRSRTKERF